MFVEKSSFKIIKMISIITWFVFMYFMSVESENYLQSIHFFIYKKNLI